MSFCWFTSFIGYPNFFSKSGHAYDLGRSFIKMAEASLAGKSYSDSKDLFPNLDPSQVETKKAAFQEFGLIYVVPRSNVISLTPVGKQIYYLVNDRSSIEKNRRAILLSLSHALARYQFDNPLPVGGMSKLDRAHSSDVLPYLACYYLLLKLNGIITLSELKGAVFGLQSMKYIRDLAIEIEKHRKSASQFPALASLPVNSKTSDNLKIYFISHLSLDGEILQTTTADYYQTHEPAFELTQFGSENLQSVLSEYWPGWEKNSSVIPKSNVYNNIIDYFTNGIGKECSSDIVNADASKALSNTIKFSDGVLEPSEVDDLRQLPLRSFFEGKKRLVQHARLERVRNLSLVREAKRLYRKNNKSLFCEVCKFDFEIKYGLRGKNYIEAHHKIPISELNDSVELSIDDLAMVCSNCHRMLHRHPWITIGELKRIITE